MIYTILAILPFLIIIGLLVFKRMSAFKVMSIAYFFTLIMLFFVWKIEEISLFSSSITGIIKALDIFLIIFSVLLLFDLLKVHGNLETLKDFFRKYTKDKNILIILIGWFFVSFFEAIAGFGTPAAICAPLLVFLGIRPLTAVIITLIADSLAVPFGAFGTPILGGLTNFSRIHSDISFYIAILNFFIAIFMPLVLLFVYYKLEKKPLLELKKYIKFALFSGLSFAIPYLIGAFYIGSEIPSVLGSLFGLGFVLIALDKNFLINIKRNKIKNKSEIFRSFSPYLFLILALIITRVFTPIKNFLKNDLQIGFKFLDVNTNLNLYSPWSLIFLTFILFAIKYKTKSRNYKNMLVGTFNKSKNAFLTLIFTLMFVQLLMNSSNEVLKILSIPDLIGNIFSDLGIFYTIFSPFLGAFGAFIAGSATVSNIIFSPLQAQVSNLNHISTPLILALQSIGAGAGNMIAIHNIVAVCTLVGLKNKESNIIRTNILVVLIYCLIVGLMGFCISYFNWGALYLAVFN